jgi:hypothetical protein
MPGRDRPAQGGDGTGQGQLAKTHPDLAAEFYLMALDGKAERVV